VGDERSVSDVLQEIVRNIQEMVRSELRLAKVEMRDELGRAVSSGLWIAAGAAGAVSAWTFLLWTLTYGLATQMPMWTATLVVAVIMAAVAAVLMMGGIRRARRIQPIPERTVESVKESLEWMKQPTK
jgi:hypothetical protein